jgi:anti-sigma factor RsiW
MMNCESFQNVLHEYIDGALDAGGYAEAQLHLQRCSACRHAVACERALAHVMHQSLGDAAAGLSVDPEVRREILEALAANPSPRGSWLAALRASTLAWPALAAAAVLCVGVVLYEAAVHRFAAKAAIQRQSPQDFSSSWVIDVPVQTQRHVFQRRANTVVDSIVDEMGGAHAGLNLDSGEQNPKTNPHPL